VFNERKAPGDGCLFLLPIQGFKRFKGSIATLSLVQRSEFDVLRSELPHSLTALTPHCLYSHHRGQGHRGFLGVRSWFKGSRSSIATSSLVQGFNVRRSELPHSLTALTPHCLFSHHRGQGHRGFLGVRSWFKGSRSSIATSSLVQGFNVRRSELPHSLTALTPHCLFSHHRGTGAQRFFGGTVKRSSTSPDKLMNSCTNELMH
jgi:hypothetical protein